MALRGGGGGGRSCGLFAVHLCLLSNWEIISNHIALAVVRAQTNNWLTDAIKKCDSIHIPTHPRVQLIESDLYAYQ